jgi:uncharacterized OB-fold protein
MVEFDGGGKAFLDFTDCDLNQIKVGMPIQMSFRRRMKDQTPRVHRLLLEGRAQGAGKGV